MKKRIFHSINLFLWNNYLTILSLFMLIVTIIVMIQAAVYYKPKDLTRFINTLYDIHCEYNTLYYTIASISTFVLTVIFSVMLFYDNNFLMWYDELINLEIKKHSIDILLTKFVEQMYYVKNEKEREILVNSIICFIRTHNEIGLQIEKLKEIMKKLAKLDSSYDTLDSSSSSTETESETEIGNDSSEVKELKRKLIKLFSSM